MNGLVSHAHHRWKRIKPGKQFPFFGLEHFVFTLDR